MQPKAIILSGGPNSVHLEDSPQLAPGLLQWALQQRIPVLGVCYGLQLLVHVRSLLRWCDQESLTNHACNTEILSSCPSQ